MKDFVSKGSDFLSAEETLGVLLDRLGCVVNVPDKYGNNRAILSKDIVIEVRMRRNRKEKKGKINYNNVWYNEFYGVCSKK